MHVLTVQQVIKFHSFTVNILDEVSIQDNAILVNYTSDGRPIYFVNKTITGPASSMNWRPISVFIENGFGFIMEWLPATPDAFVGQIMAINKGMDNEFSVRIEDSPESSGTMFRQRMVVNIPEASENVVFDLIGDAVINTGELWQYGLTYDGRVFRFYFNCDAELAAPERDPGFFITNTSMIEVGDPRGIPFLVCIINILVLCKILHNMKVCRGKFSELTHTKAFD